MNCLDQLQNHHSSPVHIPGPYFLNKVIKIPVRICSWTRSLYAL